MPYNRQRGIAAWFASRKLQWKFALVMVTILLPILAEGMWRTSLVLDIKEDAQIVHSLRLPVARGVMDIDEAFTIARASLRDYLLTGDREHQNRMVAAWRKLEAAMQEYDKLSLRFTDKSNVERWKRLREHLENTKRLQTELVATVVAGKTASPEIIAMLYSKVLPEARLALAILRGENGAANGLVERQFILLSNDMKDASDISTTLIWSSGASLLIALMAVGLGMLILGWGVTRPFVALTGAVNAVARRDYSAEITALGRADEIGDMASALMVFREGLAEADRLAQEAQIRAQADAQRQIVVGEAIAKFEQAAEAVVITVSSAATELEAAARDLTGAAQEATSEAASVSAASEQATANMSSVAAAGEELAATAGEIARLLSSSRDAASASADRMATANENVQALADAASRIGAVINLINGLAEQTNLLALNATIEAARAGEAGRGFAVVASEVKALAGQTAKATSEIAEMVQQIQEVTGRTVRDIRDIGSGIGAIESSGVEIAAAVSQQEGATQEIARNVQETAKGVEDVTRAISHVSSAANGTAAASEQVLSSAGDLARQAEIMRAEVQHFLATVRAA